MVLNYKTTSFVMVGANTFISVSQVIFHQGPFFDPVRLQILVWINTKVDLFVPFNPSPRYFLLYFGPRFFLRYIDPTPTYLQNLRVLQLVC